MVTQKEIIEALHEASTQAFYGDFRPLIDRIEAAVIKRAGLEIKHD